MQDKQSLATEDKSDWFFYFLVILIAIYILIKTVQWPVEKRIDVLLLQQNGSIENIYTTQDPKFIADFEVDTVHFPEGEVFYHHNFGYSDFSKDFFLKVQTQMQVLKAGQYNFSIRSDDGFILSIDQKEICKHPEGRPMGETLCSTQLEKGLHHFEISYYQGYGYLGLEARYEFNQTSSANNKLPDNKPNYLPQNSLNMRFIGRDSEEVIFHPMKKTDLYVNQ